MSRDMTPTTPLADDESVLQSFSADRATYVRANAWMAAAAMLGGMIILWLLGNPHVWTGAVGGLAAVAVRAAYLQSEEMAVRWDLTDARLLGPAGRAIRLDEIDQLNTLGGTVQVVTRSGDKHLIKYQADAAATIAAIQRAGHGAA